MNYYSLLCGIVSASWRTFQGWIAAVLLIFLALGTAIPTVACPFCNAASLILSEEIQIAAISTGQPKTIESPTDENSPTDNADANARSPRTAQDIKTSNTPPAKPEPKDLLAKPGDKGTLSEPPSRLTMIGVPLIAGLIFMAIFAVLLRGSDFRDPNSS